MSSFSLVSLSEVCRSDGFAWGLSPLNSLGTRGRSRQIRAIRSLHVDDPDARHMETMLQSLVSESGEASSWRQR